MYYLSGGVLTCVELNFICIFRLDLFLNVSYIEYTYYIASVVLFCVFYYFALYLISFSIVNKLYSVHILLYSRPIYLYFLDGLICYLAYFCTASRMTPLTAVSIIFMIYCKQFLTKITMT